MESGSRNRMISLQDKHIFICTGEASGDLLGGSLAQALLEVNPRLRLTGIGDAHMQKAGVEIIQDLSKMGMMGVFELLKHIKTIYTTIKTIKKYLKENRPDLLILVDYPGLNLHIARYAKKIGLKVLFYVSPQIWGWRYGRIKRIRRDVDHMAVLYRFEESLYQRENVPVSFVGHPIKQVAKASLDKTAIYKKLQLDPTHPIIALFPGSRKQEVTKLLSIMLDAKKRIQKALPNAQFAMPIASTLGKDFLQGQVPSDVTLVDNDTYNLLAVTDAAIAASGTATLEIGLMNVPLVIVYKLAAPTYWAIMCMTKTRHIGLCNIIAQEIVAKEFLQHNATADNLAKEAVKLVLDKEYRANIKRKLSRIQEGLGDGSPAKKAAAVVFELLQ
ncbi:MAG: lipid-A-disaccharide synthase [Coxiella sp. (in: Bacteria)]|nr:MAG: lipid-A-disaccharide synthase [Coxiella sp. (in: g-proteobacteria)]